MNLEQRSTAMRDLAVTPRSTIDRETSLRVAQRIRAQYRRCWINAALSLHHLGGEALYVEGWIVVERIAPLVVEHGWCEVAGQIIDPTYTPYVSTLEEPLAYFPGMRIEPVEAVRALRLGRLPINWLRDPVLYNQAFEDAFSFTKACRGQRAARPSTGVVHCRKEAFDIYIGRPTVWGNPFRVGIDGNRTEVIEKFREWIIRRPAHLRAVESLGGKVLGCFCTPARCHGDVLAALADVGEVIAHPAPPA